MPGWTRRWARRLRLWAVCWDSSLRLCRPDETAAAKRVRGIAGATLGRRVAGPGEGVLGFEWNMDESRRRLLLSLSAFLGGSSEDNISLARVVIANSVPGP